MFSFDYEFSEVEQQRNSEVSTNLCNVRNSVEYKMLWLRKQKQKNQPFKI
jgi:hypothetical protein